MSSIRKTLGRLVPRNVRNARSRPARLRPDCEDLETHRVISIDFPSLAGGVDSALVAAQATADGVLGRSTVALPVIGTPARDLAKSFDGVVGEARGALSAAINALNPLARPPPSRERSAPPWIAWGSPMTTFPSRMTTRRTGTSRSTSA